MRDRWSSKTLFLFAAIGSAVGLGNIWRFPYLSYEYGGGAFLIPYLIALLVLGIPLLIMEFAIGQKLQKGAVEAFKSLQNGLKGVGAGAVFAGFMVVVYYAVVMAWALIYLFQSFDKTLPWAADSSGHFFGSVLNLSDGIHLFSGINWPIFFALAGVWILIYFSVWKGVKSVEKVVAVTMPLPLILLFVLFIRGITLEGAFVGIAQYIIPDFSALADPQIWTAAASQIFFTLSLGFGIMIAYASYNKKNADITSNAMITAVSNSAISLFSGFVVFSVLGYMATATGSVFSDVVAGGPGLAFVTFPQALSLMPWAGFFAVLFFVTLLSLGIDSAFSLVESVNTVFLDRLKRVSKPLIAFLICTLAFVLGIIFTTGEGLYYLDIMDHYVVNYGLVIVALLQTLVVGWVYGAEKLRNYINDVSSIKIGKWWNFSIKYLAPVILTVLLILTINSDFRAVNDVGEAVYYGGYGFKANIIALLIIMIPMTLIFILGFLLDRKKTVDESES